MATRDDDVESVGSTAQLQNVASALSTSGSLPQPRIGQKSNSILVITEAAKESSEGSYQFETYCKYAGLDLRIESSKAATCHFGFGSTQYSGTASIVFLICNL